MKNDLPMTLKQIGEELGISTERVRQIEEQALKKLYRKLKKIGIYKTLDLVDELTRMEGE